MKGAHHVTRYFQLYGKTDFSRRPHALCRHKRGLKKGEPMSYKITVLPGDGIGKEVTREAINILKTIEKKHYTR